MNKTIESLASVSPLSPSLSLAIKRYFEFDDVNVSKVEVLLLRKNLLLSDWLPEHYNAFLLDG